MAGTIIADFIRADANKFSINVGNTIIASVNSLGILSNTGNVMISSSGTYEANNMYYNGSSVLTSGRVKSALQPAGSVLQIVNGSFGTQVSTTSGTYGNTGFSLTITPSSSSSNILAFMTCNGYQTSSAYLWFTLYRGATNIGHSNYGFGELYGNTGDRFGQVSGSILDSPATTSPVTYTVYFKVSAATGYINLNTGSKSTMTLMEIAG